MNFQNFMDLAAYWYLQDENFQKITQAIDIAWDNLPNHFLGPNTVKRYHEFRNQGLSHDFAKDKISDDLSVLNQFIDDLRAISITNPKLLREQYRVAISKHYATILGNQILQNPENTRALISKYTNLSTSRGLDWFSLTDCLLTDFHDHLQAVNDGTAIITLDGFEQLSKMIGGFNPSRLILIMAKSGYGKTNLALNLALNTAKNDYVAYVNMEMARTDLSKRITMILTHTSYEDYYAANLDSKKVEQAIAKIGDKFLFTSGNSLSLKQIKAWVGVIPQKPKLLIVDYDQKIIFDDNKNLPEWKAMQDSIVELEEFAKEQNICVLVMAQVNRQGRDKRKPACYFPGSYSLTFLKDNNSHAIVARKNRHGREGAAIFVEYESRSPVIKELYGIDDYESSKPVPEKKKETPKEFKKFFNPIDN